MTVLGRHIDILGQRATVALGLVLVSTAAHADSDDIVSPTLPSGHEVIGAVDHAPSGGLPQFDPTWFPSQLFWLGVTFAVLYVFFARVALPRLADTIEMRANKIKTDISTAEELAAQAKGVRETYERHMAKARDRAVDAMRAVDTQIKAETNDMLFSYRTKVTMELARAEDELAREKAKLMTDMQTLAAETAARAAGMILDTSVDMDTARRVVSAISQPKQAA